MKIVVHSSCELYLRPICGNGANRIFWIVCPSCKHDCVSEIYCEFNENFYSTTGTWPLFTSGFKNMGEGWGGGGLKVSLRKT